MCHPVGAAASATLVAGGTAVYLYTGQRVGLTQTLGGLLAFEVVTAIAMVAWIVLSMRRAHAPENIVEHMHTHPLHRHKTHPLLVQEYGSARGTVAEPAPAPQQAVQSGPVWPQVQYEPMKERA